MKDLIGEKFGRLLVLEKTNRPAHVKGYGTYYNCKCDCGKEVVVRNNNLTNGNAKSCGCLAKDRVTTHGMSKTRIYGIWINMQDRCNNKENNNYHRYGGRGITVCERWLDLDRFLEDMLESYLEFEKVNGENSATIDRIDFDGNYCKENCRWATMLEQSRNKSDNVWIVVDGVEYATISMLAEAYKLNVNTVSDRYGRGLRGLDLVTEPNSVKNIKKERIVVEVDGVTYPSLSALQRAYPHITVMTISRRYRKGKRGADLIS